MSTGRTVTVVLGGGRGTRLSPLTKQRAKPAVPLGAKYRLVDIPLSNAINSGLREVFVLTQFNSASLNAHIARTYRFDMFSIGSVEVLAAEQTEMSRDWFQGTADAVRQHLDRFLLPGVEDVLILSGDHLYRMDYEAMIACHRERQSDITISTIPVARSQVHEFGILAADADGGIFAFREKPSKDEDISILQVPEGLRDHWQMSAEKEFLASMGVYVFRAEVLREVLENPEQIDFGKHILPAAIEERPVGAYVFDGYWEDIGTIGSFYEANMLLCGDRPPFRFYVPTSPVYTRPRFLPPSVYRDSHVRSSIIAEGCLVFGTEVRDSVIGLRSRIDPGAIIDQSIVMGADYYEVDDVRDALVARGEIPIGVGEGAVIRRAIIDKNARIGAGAVIEGRSGRPDAQGDGWLVRDGIVIVEKGAVVPPGAVL